MRAITVTVTPPEGAPPNRLFEDGTDVYPERVHNFNVLDDGSIVLLGRIRGDLDRIRAILEADPDVLGFSISGEDERGGLVYVHSRPPPAVAAFLGLPHEHEVFFDFPVEATPDGRYRVDVVGETNEVLQAALADVHEGIEFSVERIGPYLEERGDLAALLTERQCEVLAAARDLGYYRVPREATHRDIADRLDIATGTVAEHLQKIEARIIGALDA
ncbi:helix-turn-helix domain-containing protein [Haloglomus litoreum]|uniref:helix-turn-helix domain-containing protein n=1 Tax=Haloglomus litoreum TaxID=3034026 RepID=UPI0023E8772F|nr:helix-turn-helix domain-containing protein [Haloglomus sp. DT116]